MPNGSEFKGDDKGDGPVVQIIAVFQMKEETAKQLANLDAAEPCYRLLAEW